MLASVDLILVVPFHFLEQTGRFGWTRLRSHTARLEGRRRRLVRGDGRRHHIFIDEGSNDWLEIYSIQLADIIEIVLDMSQQRILLGVDLMHMLAHPVRRGRRVMPILLSL
jgi:hypothetical protein